jgi:hypothetical protein
VFSTWFVPRSYNQDCYTNLFTENIRGLNLAVVKPMTVQVTKLPLWHKISKIGMICSVEPVLTEDLCVVQKEQIFNNMLYV